MMCARMSTTYTTSYGRANNVSRCVSVCRREHLWRDVIAWCAVSYEAAMTPSQMYWATLDPVIKENRLAAMRAYSKKRTALMPKKPRKITTRNLYSHKPRNQELLYQFVVDCKIKLGKCYQCLWECEQWNHVCFAFDHLDPTKKLFPLSRAPKIAKMTERRILDEIAKCHLVCHNCHALRTWVYRDHDYAGHRIDVPIMPSLLDCPEWDVA